MYVASCLKTKTAVALSFTLDAGARANRTHIYVTLRYLSPPDKALIAISLVTVNDLADENILVLFFPFFLFPTRASTQLWFLETYLVCVMCMCICALKLQLNYRPLSMELTTWQSITFRVYFIFGL